MNILISALIFFIGLLLFFRLGFWLLHHAVSWAILAGLSFLMLGAVLLNFFLVFPFFLLFLPLFFYLLLHLFSFSWKQALFLTVLPPFLFFMIIMMLSWVI